MTSHRMRMPPFDPTRPRPGRLARLGVVVDPSDPRSEAIARLCDRAGIEIVWYGDPAPDPSDAPREDRVMGAPAPLSQARVGWYARDGKPVPDAAAETWYPDALRGPDPGVDERPRRSATLLDLAELPGLLSWVDDIVLPAWRFVDLETTADEVRAEAAESGRDPATLGVATVLPVSVGRTEAEASARADDDEGFRRVGHPRDVGIFGTLEECQDRVIALAHAGVTDLRCILPSTMDVHDVIAQLTAITIGTTDVLVPGTLRSDAPPPPEGWGGRPDVPPRPGVSGGSRRR